MQLGFCYISTWVVRSTNVHRSVISGNAIGLRGIPLGHLLCPTIHIRGVNETFKGAIARVRLSSLCRTGVRSLYPDYFKKKSSIQNLWGLIVKLSYIFVLYELVKLKKRGSNRCK
jgi:hypothetical protein